ncbi:MAG TPA: glycosyltransferase [Terrimicrobiaceae bacterium]
MSVSIIIPTCNRTTELHECLSALVPQLPSDGSATILVCDDGRDETTKSMIAKEFPVVRWNQGPRRGPATNRNFGARQADGDWLIFLDDDCNPRAGYLAAYLKQMELVGKDARVALEGATLRTVANPSLLWEAPHNPEGGVLISCNFAMPRLLFLECGSFDERYPAANFEDTEFDIRIRIKGVKIIFLPDAVVDHPMRPLPEAIKLARRWESRVVSTYEFGASPGEVLLHLPRHIAMVILSRFRGRKFDRDTRKAALEFFKEFLLTLWYLPGWLRKHQSVPRSEFWTEQRRLGKNVPKRFGL